MRCVEAFAVENGAQKFQLAAEPLRRAHSAGRPERAVKAAHPPKEFCKAADKLTFKVTLPVMLFLDMAEVDMVHDFEPKFVLFCAGLAALTLFPANLWSYVMDLGRGWHEGTSFFSFYPTWEETLAGLDYLDNMLTPLQEIRRALNSMSYWLMFMLWGNIAMFVPIGFFPALLWRGWRWWKALLLGCLTSCAIEFIQFFIGRSTDIDDVILNTTGALLGYGLFRLCRALCPGALARFHCRPTEEC